MVPLDLLNRDDPLEQLDAPPAVQFEWEDEPRPRAVRLVSESARVGDPVRVTVAGVEVEGRIEGVESSNLRVRVGRRLF